MLVKHISYMRMKSHKFNIRNMDDPNFSTNVAIHFNSDEHAVEDFRFMPIDRVSDNMQRLLKFISWILYILKD